MGAQLRLWDRDTTPVTDHAGLVLAIRESARARQLILQALPPRTVEVVVPRGMRSEIVQSFICEHRDWIDRAGSELVAAYPDAEFRPERIVLAAIGESVSVRYHEASGTRSRHSYVPGELDLYCPAGDNLVYATLIRRWLLEQGRRVLRPWLASVAVATGLSPKRTQVRLQKTRWGSCSANGSISVNASLLLVPPELVRYLFIHELCHLLHMSHSRRYWQAVARYAPDYRDLDRQLAATWQQLPAWIYALTNGDSLC